MDFAILGRVEALADGRPVALGRRQERLLLGLLLLDPAQPVADDRLIDLIWGDEPPETARRTLRTYASRLRSALREGGIDLAYRAGAYLVDCDPGSVDLHRFIALVAAGRTAAGLDERSGLLQAALELWRGDVLGDAAPDHLRHWLDATYGEHHLSAAELYFDTEITAGRHRAVTGPLAAWHGRHPTREPLAGLRMRALYRAERQTDALAVYRQTRQAIIADFGVEPGPALQALHSQILQQHPSLTAVCDPSPAVPHNLPPQVAGFLGRGDEQGLLEQMLAAGEAGESPVAVITGMPGIGKTALAIRWAHHVAHRFPNGVIYVDLRGYGGASRPLRPIDAIARIVSLLGVAHENVPIEFEHAWDFYRQTVSRLRILLVLDNARTADQVRPLLPNGRHSAAVVTSRERLAGLVALDGARPIPLDVLDGPRSEELLRTVIGTERFIAAPDAARRVAELCGGLPLALRIAAAAIAETGVPMPDYLKALESSGHRMLRLGGDPATSIPVVFGYSYDQLNPDEQALLRLMGALGMPSYGTDSMAAAAALSLGDTERLLSGLLVAGLIEQDQTGRYFVHDLLAGYAADLATIDEVRVARERLHTWYYQRSSAASRRLFPAMLRLDSPIPVSGEFADESAATQWLAAEHACLVAAVRQAAEGHSAYAWLICDAMRGYFWSVRTYIDWVACAESATAAAEGAGDAAALGASHFSLGTAMEYLNRYDDAAGHYDEAHRLFSAAGWARGVASVAGNHANLAFTQGLVATAATRFERAVDAFQSLGLNANVVVQRNNVSSVYFRMGRLAEAYDCAAEAAAWFRAHDQPHQLATALLNQATAAAGMNQDDEAIALLAEADRLFTEAGSADGGACVAETLAALHRDAGRLDIALDVITEAYRTAREVGDSRVETHTLITLASIQLCLSRTAESASSFSEALSQATATQNLLLQAEAIWGLATVAADRGDRRAASATAREAINLAQRIGYHALAEKAGRLYRQWMS